MRQTLLMKISERLRNARGRDQQTRKPDQARAVDEQRAMKQAKAWERPGGPVDPGATA